MEESKMAFADHSGFEFDGGSVKLLLARDLNSVLIANVATTGDGAVLSCRNAFVELTKAHFFEECHTINVNRMLATLCSAETRGGDYFIPSLDQNSDLNLQPTLIECSAKLGG
ncbi:hypothetical protein BLNAU_19361 [Blattamonas nauphoetae]|uniref:Uncharacterized protein n=1 Tax=Blattamonas nauphoetae TaxID=2049346 RepID=A0ABQ9X1N0_9EUKA|nr:hypothetical protein BLNAU_19361 [Blattamonas nauphoetae]